MPPSDLGDHATPVHMPWIYALDEGSGATYYINTETNASTKHWCGN